MEEGLSWEGRIGSCSVTIPPFSLSLLNHEENNFFLISLLGYNCLTMFCQFLLYNKVKQLYVHIYPHISSLLGLPPTLPIPPLQVVTKHELISLFYAAASHQLYILQLVVCICPCHSLISSQLTLPPPRVLKSILYVFVFTPVLPLGSSEPFLSCKPVHLYHFSRFHIYALIYDICFSLSDFLHSV